MKLPQCLYGYDLESDLRRLHDEVRKLTERQVDGDNISPELLGDGLEFGTFTASTPGKIIVSITNTTNNTYFSPKGDGFSPETFYGMELIVDASSASYGRFCVVDKDYLSQQLISLIPEDPASVASPGGTISFPYGTGIFEGFAGDEFVFNESSIDVNFRVESNGDANNIFSDGGTDRVGIGTSSPLKKLHVGAGADTPTTTSDGIYVSNAGVTGVAVRDSTNNHEIALQAGTTRVSVGGATDSITNIIQNNSTVIGISVASDAYIELSRTYRPATTNTYDSGTSSLAWQELYTRKIDTDGAQTLTIQRNDADHLTFDGAVNVPVALKTGDFRANTTTQTASNGGSYSVAATVGTVFVAAAALTAGQNYTVNLPSAVTYSSRIISVKITTTGTATSTITVDADAGNVEGAATSVFQANVRTGATFYSDGTDWWEIGQFAIA